MGLTPPTWMCVLSWSLHPHPPETMCNQWVLIGTFNYKPETYLLQWVQHIWTFHSVLYVPYLKLPCNCVDQWIQLCLSSERHIWPSNCLQQWEFPHLSGEPKSGNAYDLSLSGSVVVMDCALGITVYVLPQIQSSNSAGRENVNTSIIWMNPSTGLRHTIDVLSPVNCECGLVCMVFMKSISQWTLLLAGPQKKLVGLLCVVLWSYTTIVLIQEGLVILAN